MRAQELIFVTGAIRSGTTLLTRLLAHSLGTPAALQPLPLMLVRLKADFLAQTGAPQWHIDYPLSDDIFATAFDHDAFTRYLTQRVLPPETVAQWFEEDRHYSGVLHHPKNGTARLNDWQGGGLASFVSHYLMSDTGLRDPIVWKEVFSESYLSYLLQHNISAILIIRDPRDVVLSQSVSGGKAYVGSARPLLYQIRQWRKSVAWALWLEDQSKGQVIRFEDLVGRPERTVSIALDQLCPNRMGRQSLKDFDPGSNSSFTSESETGDHSNGQINPLAAGRYSENMPIDDMKFIEACCLPELRCLGYPVDMSVAEALQQLGQNRADASPLRQDLKHYQYTPARAQEEKRRLQSLCEVAATYDSNIHITEAAFQKLVAAFRG